MIKINKEFKVGDTVYVSPDATDFYGDKLGDNILGRANKIKKTCFREACWVIGNEKNGTHVHEKYLQLIYRGKDAI